MIITTENERVAFLIDISIRKIANRHAISTKAVRYGPTETTTTERDGKRIVSKTWNLNYGSGDAFATTYVTTDIETGAHIVTAASAASQATHDDILTMTTRHCREGGNPIPEVIDEYDAKGEG